MMQTPQDWLNDFFVKRSLERADGRALYKYRTTDAEFAALQNILKDYESHHLWNQLFVLYAAEWWRRNFDGGHWAWDLIFNSLDVPQPAVAQRNNIIEEGLSCWGRSVYRVNRQRGFLASIVIEGGLPIQTVANNTGWLSTLLRNSFSIYYKQRQRYQDRLPDLIKGYADTSSAALMPQALQKDEVFSLLAEIVEGLAYLKDTYPLIDKESPADFLDTQNLNWREVFPLPIKSDTGRKFLDELLSEVATISSEPPPKYPFRVKRTLRQTDEGWRLHAEVKLEGDIKIESLDVLEENKHNLLPTMRVSIQTSSGERIPVTRAHKTQDILKLSILSGSVPRRDASAAISLCLSAQEPIILPLTKGEALEDDQPWVFVKKDDEWDYVGQASQNVHDEEALVVVKDDLHPSDSTLEPIGTVLGDRRIYKICKEVTFENEEGKFRLRTCAKDMDGEEYVLEGTRLLFSSNPSWTCLGRPRLYLRNVQTHSKWRTPDRLEVKVGTGWERLSDTHQGVVSLRFKDSEDYVVFRKRVAILPADFSFSFQADSTTPSRGNIIVRGAGEFCAHITDETINATIAESEEQLEIALHSDKAMPPERVHLHLSRTIGQDVIFTLPFPASGVRAFDANNQPLSNKRTVFLNQLHGIRLRLFNGQDSWVGRYQIKMDLCDETIPHAQDIYFDEIRDCPKETLEIPLIDYVDKIRELLSISDRLDAYVSFNISLLRGNDITLNIYQYAAIMKEDSQVGCVALEGRYAFKDDLEAINVLASLVSKPEQSVLLAPLTSGGAHRASWDFLSSGRGDGPWIIYPDRESAVQFRPLFWPIGQSGAYEHATTLQAAVAIQDDADRTAAIRGLITAMARNFAHPSWGYIDALWKAMGHLPLPRFDIWQIFADNPPALVALLCQGDEELLNRMSQEFPIMWELIPMGLWQKVFCDYHEYLGNNFAAARDVLLKLKLDYIDIVLGMNNLALTLKQSIGMDAPDQPEVTAGVLQHLLNQEYSGAQDFLGLIGRQGGNENWPMVLSEEIEDTFAELPEVLRAVIPQNLIPEESQSFRKPVIYLPIVLAYESLVASSENRYDSLRVFKIKMIRDFDARWFDEVFNLIQGYWHSQQ